MPGYNSSHNVIKNKATGSSGKSGAAGLTAGALDIGTWAIGICTDIEYGPTRNQYGTSIYFVPNQALQITEWWDCPLHSTNMQGLENFNTNFSNNGGIQQDYLIYNVVSTPGGPDLFITSRVADGDAAVCYNKWSGTLIDMVPLYEAVEKMNLIHAVGGVAPLITNLTYENLPTKIIQHLICHFDFGFLPSFSRHQDPTQDTRLIDMRNGDSTGYVKNPHIGTFNNLGFKFDNGCSAEGKSQNLPLGVTDATFVFWLTSHHTDPGFPVGVQKEIFYYGDPSSRDFLLAQQDSDYYFGNSGSPYLAVNAASNSPSMITVKVDSVNSQITLCVDGSNQFAGPYSFTPNFINAANKDYFIARNHMITVHMLSIYDSVLEADDLDLLYLTFKTRYGL